MASAADSKAKETVPAETPADQAKLPQLGALEEDDEFEEFPVADWDDSQTTLERLTKSSTSTDPSKPAVNDQLWEDNWDDDDVEDDFSKRLREELSKTATTTTAASGSTGAAQPADTVMS